MQNRKKKGCQGSTVIEFAFVLIPLLAVVFGAIEMDRMLLAYSSLCNAAKTGVRYAIVHGKYADGPINPTTTNEIGQLTQKIAALGLIDSSRMAITEDCTDGTGAYIHVCYQDGNTNVGSRVSVSVSYPYDPFTSFFPLSVRLSSTAKGVIAF